MENKIVPIQIYEDDRYVAFLNPVEKDINVYQKTEDDFHNKYAERILTLVSSDRYSQNISEQLLYKLLIEKKEGK